MKMKPPKWVYKPLAEMSKAEWDALCDGCGKCCVLKLEDADSGEIYATDVGCKLLNCQNAQCQDYENRQTHVPDCVVLNVENLSTLTWMPKSCAYRCLYEGRDLPNWHPLVTGTQQSVIDSGHSVAGRIFPEDSVDMQDLSEHIVDWDNLNSCKEKA